MSTNRVAAVEAALDACVAGLRAAAEPLDAAAPLRPGSGLGAGRARALFEDQVLSRQLDVAARELKKSDQGFYTIGSAGHEQNAVLGAQLRLTDPCVLHYRSGALMLARARQLPGSTPVFDTLLSLSASSDDPIAEGRHKVWGSKALWVPPQTSTIASHLPKAAGMALALGLARRLGRETGLPADAVVLCSFGDASLNHATALSGLNAARYMARRGAPVPILWACEDNGVGISVETPSGWIEEQARGMSRMAYFRAEGDLAAIWDACAAAIAHCRSKRSPTFLHLPTVRLWGHAGSDQEAGYRTLAEIEAVEARDPLLANARLLVESGAATPDELAELLRSARARVAAAAVEASRRGKLATLAQVTRTLAPHDEARTRADVAAAATPHFAAARAAHWGAEAPEAARSATKRTLAALINAALADELLRRPEMLVFGEDVGKKGGVYGVTQGLQKRFGPARVFDTLLDETTILGIAQGAATLGLLPVPEIQYLAYVHNAIDQLRGEACSLAFFSSGQFVNPMVVRIQGLGYQKGFGGHFHNDNAIGALREIPGLVLAVPGRGDDAARMLRGCLALARANGRVCAFLEPIALYHERDLHDEGDGLMLSEYPPPGEALFPGEVGVHGAGNRDLALFSYGNGLRIALRAARRLERGHGVAARVVDLRWLNPLPLDAIEEHARACAAALVVDECRATGAGIADAVVAHLAERRYAGRVASVRSADSFVPLGPAAAAVLVQEDDVLRAALELAR